MKKLFCIGVCTAALLMVVAAAQISFGVTATYVSAPYQSLDIKWSAEEIDVGETLQLSLTDAVSWESFDTDVASVNQAGCVTGLAKGEATITGETANGVRTTFIISVK